SLPPPSFAALNSAALNSAERHSAERRSQTPSERDPWLLANKTLELSRANARISTLEDQIAFRDARIMTLEERLDAAQLKIDELEHKLDTLPMAAGSAGISVSGPSS